MTTARAMYERAGWTIAFALVLYYINRQEYPGPALQLTAVIVLIGAGMGAAGYGLAWLAGPGRQRTLGQVLDSAKLQGSERVLDVGSGGGELGLEAARKLSSGKVISLGDSAANVAPREQAKNEGLGDRVRFEATDWSRLSYPDGNFDSVIGSDCLGLMETESKRKLAALEMYRVLKPGGILSLHETSDLRNVLHSLTQAGFSVEQRPSGLPFSLGGCVFTSQKSK